MAEQGFTSGLHFHKKNKGIIERITHGLLHAIEHAVYAEEIAKRNGFLQNLDPRVKIAGFLALIIAVVQSKSLVVIAGVFGVTIVIALLSKVPLKTLAGRVWIGVLLFTGVIALPAIFMVSGTILYRLPLLNWPITEDGLRSAAFLIARAKTAATCALLLILCTPWNRLLKALRIFRVPTVVIVILGMTHRYIFPLLQTVQDMFEARSRLIGKLSGSDKRHLATASAGVLLGKSFRLSNDVYLAMQSRGFRGEVHILDNFEMKQHDWIFLAGFLILALYIMWLG